MSYVNVVLLAVLCASVDAGFGPGHGIMNKVIMARFLESCHGSEATAIMKKELAAVSAKCLTKSTTVLSPEELTKAAEMAFKFGMSPAKLAKMASMRPIIGNMTCRMQEMNMLTEDFKPNFDGIQKRITTMPIDEAVRTDALKSLNYCRAISECADDDSANDMEGFVPPKFMKAKNFFKCFFERKLMSCVKQEMKRRVADEYENEAGADFPTPLEVF